MNGQPGTKGFTLIELLVVVAIISLLSSVVFASLNAAREKARDARRMSDLSQIRVALNLYYDKYGNWMEAGSGCGYNGSGWFNYKGGSYPESMGQCLVNAGATPQEIIDPTGSRTNYTTSGSNGAYMKYTCGTPIKTYIYAKLETKPQSTTATDGTCCASCDSLYGINYYVSIE